MNFSKYINKIVSISPKSLEDGVRLILINFFWHLSNKQLFQWASTSGNNIAILTPSRFVGKGSIVIGSNVVFGVVQSPGSFSESYFEVRDSNSTISFGDSTFINNKACVISDGAKISFGQRCLIGPNLVAFDSNGHMLPIQQRLNRDNNPLSIDIGDDVFIGSNVTILKGVKIGSGCIVSAGSVLFPRFEAPPHSIVGGNPAVVIGQVSI